MQYKLPILPYDYGALEPHFDKQTMEIHYTKHHQTYVNNINKELLNLPNLSKLTAEDLISNLDKIPENKKTVIRNNLGGHINHCIFWNGLKKGTILNDDLKKIIDCRFGSFEKFKNQFEKKALNHFGSGWIWLILNKDTLEIVSTINQDSPLMGKDISGTHGFPIICLDMWEHAYYLKFQNRRLDYIKEYWNVVNWDEAFKRFCSKQ